VDASLEIAAHRMLTLDDVGLSATSAPDAVKGRCNAIAADLANQYLAGSLSWLDADTRANSIYDLMISHCGSQVPAFAWDVFLAFDEGEVDDRGDSHTRPRVTELVRKYDAA
jgi:hypothetical protein